MRVWIERISMSSLRRRSWAPVTLAITALTTAATLITPATPATSAERAESTAPAEKAVTSHRITLVTGDVVTVTTRVGDSGPAIALDPTGPSRGTAQVQHTDDATYVIPAAAGEALADNAVDLALF